MTYVYLAAESNPEKLRVATTPRRQVIVSSKYLGPRGVPLEDFLYVIRCYTQIPEVELEEDLALSRGSLRLTIRAGLPELEVGESIVHLSVSTWTALVQAVKAAHGSSWAQVRHAWSWTLTARYPDKPRHMWAVYKTNPDGSVADKTPMAAFRMAIDALCYMAQHGPDLVVGRPSPRRRGR